jgi:hypothetical protein
MVICRHCVNLVRSAPAKFAQLSDKIFGVFFEKKNSDFLTVLVVVGKLSNRFKMNKIIKEFE